jgi:F0F1-type ATP synthase membrane subunit c/vacuolar-type H+-ATPase subunit K
MHLRTWARESAWAWRSSALVSASAGSRLARRGRGRQPSAAAQISGAVNLPLFLLEGVAILAEVFALLIVLMRQ